MLDPQCLAEMTPLGREFQTDGASLFKICQLVQALVTPLHGILLSCAYQRGRASLFLPRAARTSVTPSHARQ